MTDALSDAALRQLFLDARTYNAWQPRPIEPGLIRRLYDLVCLAPTAANTSPARFAFVQSAEAKARLIPCLSPGNIEKVKSAPCCVIIAFDTQFYELMPKLFPSRDLRAAFVDRPDHILETAKRNSSLQGGYFILAARALGLDTGPMSGFDHEKLDREFFPDGRWKSNFLCNIGYGSDEGLFPRNPRLDFEEACDDI
jgi:3-hydroxypropanoate dehydrogenase